MNECVRGATGKGLRRRASPLGACVAAALRISEKAAAMALLMRERSAASSEQAREHLEFLARALEFGRPELFAGHVAWCKPTLAHRGVQPSELPRRLHAMAVAARELLPAGEAAIAAAYIDGALDALPHAPEVVQCSPEGMTPGARAYLACLLERDTEGARQVVRDFLGGKQDVAALYLDVLAPTLTQVGLLWQSNRIGVSQEHYCVGVTEMVMGEASASIPGAPGRRRRAVVACVAGEQHAIGARMVADFLALAGWDALWLGPSTPTTDLLGMVVDHRAELLALSCTHAPGLHEAAALVAGLRALPECSHVKVLVRGHAFHAADALWHAVGADAMAPDARSAADVALRIVAQGP